jgi:hypothetical protein
MIANALSRPLTAGSVDNAILRADGTDGTILQNSGLVVDDAIVAYSATGDAATDVITATGHNFIANQGVMFPSLTGGSGLNTTTVYFVRDISGSTFKVSATSGGAAINFTTDITAGSIIAIQANVAIVQNTTGTDSALVLTPKGTGALIAGQKPDGTLTGGNARGSKSICLVGDRSAATQVASGSNSVAIGYRATASGTTSLAISGAATATDAVGIRGTASGTGAVGIRGTASGVNSITIQGSASADNTIALGASASASAGTCIAIGQNTVANSFGGVAVGASSTTTSGYAFGSTSAGGDKAISIGVNNTATQYSCIAIGRLNNSTGSSDSICIGESNTSSGSRSYSIGANNSSSGQYAVALGQSNASSGDHSHASGLQSSANRYGMVGRANGQFSASGDAQSARFVMRNKTTTNSAVELFLNGSSTRLTVPSGKIIALTINIAGVSSTGAAVAHYMRQYCLKNVAGTTSEVYAPITIGTDNAAGTSIALSASDASDALVVSVTGTTSTIWRWVASVDAVEIAYGT